MPRKKTPIKKQQARRIERKSEVFNIRVSRAQSELLKSCGTAEFYRNAMIEKAKQSLGMNIEYGEVEKS